MCCCGIFGCISKILGQILTGCIPIALGVYIGLLMLWIACFMIWSVIWWGAEMFSLTWTYNGSYSLYITMSLSEQKQALWVNGGVVYSTVDADDEANGAVCADGVNWYSGVSGMYNFLIFCMLFLAHAGALKHFSFCQMFSKLPCKMCLSRMLMWIVACMTLLIWVVFFASCITNFGTKEDEIVAGGLVTNIQFQKGVGTDSMFKAVMLLIVAAVVLCIFFIPKGQKLIPGFMASEVADEAEEDSKDSGEADLKQSACSVESASTLSTLSSAEESKGDSKLAQSEESVELEVEKVA